MASITNEANGHRCIQFVGSDRKRRSIRLGKVSKRHAELVRGKVEELYAVVSVGHAMDAETSRWLSSLDDTLYARLAAVGLVKPRVDQRPALGPFIDAYIESRADIKPRTSVNMKQLRRWMVGYFGEGRDVRTIGPAEAEDFRSYMVKKGLGENTIRRHIGRARQLFKVAIRRELVRGGNPFDGMATTVRSDKSRMFFVSREASQKVLDACPDSQWRLMFALGRFGGLRCPSEHLALKWSDVNWQKSRIRVPSPKTERHEGKGERIIPLWPELYPHLREAFEQAEPGTEYVVTRYRNITSNLRTHFCRIIRKAGLQPWPKPWHNLRSTRQTELAEVEPIHRVCYWMGNSRAVAQEHYLQITDVDYAQALTRDTSGKAVQNPVQQGAEVARTESHVTSPTPVLLAVSGGCGSEHSADYPRQDSNL